ncbi:MAG: thioredoxin domain-containing protein [Acidobacteria bacterium]|nr:thioredoxin domain-containing protein [Acidobacteriota bacterium]
MPNRLAAERSPYLLQHASNPVDWYPWGEEAFARARADGKPIFLSVGYSTCHWCHVMEHESFERPDVASALNDSFVSIKVDREERPDVDRVYMLFVQATTGAGGWPMSVFLTPELKPFFGGTYFPPTSRWGRPGFIDVLQEIAQGWRTDRIRIENIAGTLIDRLRAATERDGPGTDGRAPGTAVLDQGVEQYQRTFDRRAGGFGDAPKFPRPSELLFLMREHARTRGDAERSDTALDMAVATLRAMAFGGMRDHVGGGFHRYSVDREWRVPHFEKMLYDQAQLVLAYTEAHQAAGDEFYAVVAEDTLEYVRRDLTDRAGGFFSAEDADSVPPELAGAPGARKSEGAFYLWTAEEIDRLLGDEAAVVKTRFGVLPAGNAPEDPHGEFAGWNILYTAATVEEVAQQTGRAAAEVVDVLARARPALFYARAGRPRPHLDDKVLTAWNGLMIAAFARAGRVLLASGRAPQYVETARHAAAFLRQTLWDASRRVLRRRYRDGEAAIDGYCEDYAYLVFGLLELFQATGDPQWLEWSIELQKRQDDLFGDPAGGWFSTAGDDPTVLLRLKEDYDGAEPAAGSVSVMNVLTLSHLTGEAAHRALAERALARLSDRGAEAARVSPFMCAALSAYHAGVRQIVIAGEDARALQEAVASRYQPFTVLVPLTRPADVEGVARLLPLTAGMRPRDGRPAAYVCHDFRCEAPVHDAAALRALLD